MSRRSSKIQLPKGLELYVCPMGRDSFFWIGPTTKPTAKGFRVDGKKEIIRVVKELLRALSRKEVEQLLEAHEE